MSGMIPHAARVGGKRKAHDRRAEGGCSSHHLCFNFPNFYRSQINYEVICFPTKQEEFSSEGSRLGFSF